MFPSFLRLSCKHEGYEDYPFPSNWGTDTALNKGLPDCGEVPRDGNGVPEQFWVSMLLFAILLFQ